MTRDKVIVLGPQRHAPTVREAIEELGFDPATDRFAAVTAGWEEREEELEELREHLGGDVVGLRLHERNEDVYAKDPDLLGAVRTRHDRQRKMQRLYRLRLSYALDAARALLKHQGTDDIAQYLDSERKSAIDAVRTLDDEHLRLLRTIHAKFEEKWRPGERDTVKWHREELRSELSGCKALLVAGGHVGILLDRLRMFDVASLLEDQPIIAWSAGAMALSDRVVVFHDSPPQGPGNAEVQEVGLGLFEGLVPLPHASRRLRLDDTMRVGLFARRFGPAICAALDEGTQLAWDGETWTAKTGTRRLRVEGDLEEVTAA